MVFILGLKLNALSSHHPLRPWNRIHRRLALSTLKTTGTRAVSSYWRQTRPARKSCHIGSFTLFQRPWLKKVCIPQHPSFDLLLILIIRCMGVLRGTQVASPVGFNNYYSSARMSFPSVFNYYPSSSLEIQLGFRGE